MENIEIIRNIVFILLIWGVILGVWYNLFKTTITINHLVIASIIQSTLFGILVIYIEKMDTSYDSLFYNSYHFSVPDKGKLEDLPKHRITDIKLSGHNIEILFRKICFLSPFVSS